jgi:hypothetical protein
MRRSTVVKKDTASYDVVNGSSRSEINGETIMRRSTIVKKNKAAISDVGSAERRGKRIQEVEEHNFEPQSPFCLKFVNAKWLPTKQAGNEMR